VLERKRRELSDKHPNTLTSIAKLASTYINQERWKEAKELFVQVIGTIKKQGRWKEAEDLEVQVIKARKSVLGDEHPDTLTSIANLALTYSN